MRAFTLHDAYMRLYEYELMRLRKTEWVEAPNSILLALPASQTTKPDESKAMSGDAVRFFFRLFSLTLWTKEQ